jgi:predicted dehydrogenase
MVRTARKHGRIVQVGTQQRSGRHYHKAMALVRGGYIGKVISVRGGAFRNVMPGFGAPPDGTAPSEFDYDMWLGPAPARPYNPKRGLYHFRWFWDYSGGQMTNLAAHELDVVQWFLEQKGPRAVYSTGGRLALEDNGETPDVQDSLLTYPGFTAAWSCREAAAGTRGGRALEFLGTKGSLTITRGGFQVTPDLKIDPNKMIPTFKGHPGGGPKPAETQMQHWIDPVTEKGSSDEQFDLHVRNFLDCIKTRQRPVADVEDGHHTATACHLANISLRLGRSVRWDPEAQKIAGDAEAEKHLVRPYRKPWDDVLRSILA